MAERIRWTRKLTDAGADARPPISWIDSVRGIDDRDFETWKFFEQRADALKGTLWTTATWLIGLQGGLLAFTISERLMRFGGDGLGLEVTAPLAVCVLSVIGIVLTTLTVFVVADIVKHIRRNWARANAAKGDPSCARCSGRISALVPLYLLQVLFALAFMSLLCLALLA